MARKSVKEQKQLATVISLILNPAVMFSLQMLLLMRIFSVTPQQLLLVAIPFVVPVATYILVMVFILKKVDYEFTKRETRWPVLIIAILGLFVSIPVSLHYAPSLTAYMLRMLILFVLIASVTFYWKISMHTVFFSMTILMLSTYIQPSIILMYVFLPMLYWARIILNKHTPSQLFLGTLLPILMII